MRSANRVVLFNGYTSASGVHYHVICTATHHRSHRQCINYSTGLLRQTDIRFGARILAPAVETCQLTGTILIGTALGLRWSSEFLASHIGIARRTGSTLTNRLMIHTSAKGCLGTSLCVTHFSADTVQAVTSLILGTVLVVLALASNTRYQGVALVAWLTDAIGSVILRETFCSLAAMQRSIVTRIQTLFVVAGLVIWTIGIALTFS